MTKLEQIEKLREKANISYDEARSALEAANDDLLEALISLEKQGKVNPPAGGGYTSSTVVVTEEVDEEFHNEDKRSSRGESFGDTLGKAGRFCVKMINKGNKATLDILKGEECKLRLPLTVVALLLLFAPWFTIPAILAGLVFGYWYRFSGYGWSDES